MMKKIVALVLVMMGGGFYATPYIALHNMQQAAQAKDAAALNEYIDYPAVKESLKLSMNSDDFSGYCYAVSTIKKQNG